jgi:DNA-binding protein Fis
MGASDTPVSQQRRPLGLRVTASSRSMPGDLAGSGVAAENSLAGADLDHSWLVNDVLADDQLQLSVTGACRRVAKQLGINRNTLRGWVKQAQIDARQASAEVRRPVPVRHYAKTFARSGQPKPTRCLSA